MRTHVSLLLAFTPLPATTLTARAIHPAASRRHVHADVVASRRRHPALRMSLDKGFNVLELTGKVLPQGKLVGGVKEAWKFAWGRMMAELAPQDRSGSYSRPRYSFAGVLGGEEFPFEANRYHVYLGNPCPWCHRVSLTLALTGLNDLVTSTRLVDDPTKARRGGWCFGRDRERRDPVFASEDLYGVYEAASPGFKGRCTAPLLIDKKTKRIVSNESRDIVKMLNALAADLRQRSSSGSSSSSSSSSSSGVNLRPAALEADIDAMAEWVFTLVNNGVYRCGFATSQASYDRAATDVREGLSRLEAQLEATASSSNSHDDSSFLLPGSEPTELDVLLLPTLLRFDAAYAPLFRAGGGQLRVRDYPRLHAWLRACWAIDGVPGTIDLEDAWGSYYKQLFPLNPGGLVPSLPSPRELGLVDR